jgi:hypothetical protein
MSQDRTYMQLWSDYEGKTLAGTFPIEALLLTEGRNASFATHDRTGRPAVLRLTEALNDQEEMRERYSAIRGVGQPNLVTIEDYGDVEMEGTPLIYLVMEPTQESLADIIRERCLTIEETGEVATSLVGALEALHAHGLMHGQVEPASVLAAGQVIKLRSDCVRAIPEGEAGDRARAEDVFGLADVLNRSLTQQQLLDASDALALPEPYASIVRNVVRGHWGLEEVAAEVRRFVRPAAVPAPAPVATAASVMPAPPIAPVIAAPASVAPAPLVVDLAASAANPAPAEMLAPMPAAIPAAPTAVVVDAVAAKAPQSGSLLNGSDPRAAAVPVSASRPAAVANWNDPGSHSPKQGRAMVWAGVASGLAVVLLLVWHFAGSGANPPAPSSVANAAATPTAVTAPAAPPPAAVTDSKPRAAVVSPAAVPLAAPKPALHPAHALLHGDIWRVVAYTYNVESQARSKAAAIGKQHPDLHPEVFSPTGHAPYLVTLGGPLTQQEAAALRQTARSQGLARDVYTQNYSR